MPRGRKDELRVGPSLRGRFVLSMTASLTLVLSIAGLALYGAAREIAQNAKDDALASATLLALDPPTFEAVGTTAVEHKSGVKIFPVLYGDSKRPGTVYNFARIGASGKTRSSQVLVSGQREVGSEILGLMVGMMLLVLVVGAGVALWVAGQVVRPINLLVDDVRQIAKGNLDHHTSARGGGAEVALLARSIDRMTTELSQAQGAQVELSIREREMGLASGVREALLPLVTPLVEGFDLGGAFLGSDEFGGDFHDFLELGDGRVGLLVCDVGGTGIPAALIGATARSYMRSELVRGEDVLASMHRINRWLVGDVRRGMYVTALYVLLDPTTASAEVVCAGHKIPLLRYVAEDGKLRVVHPEGIALGFDKGPVFERRLEVQVVTLAPGDRLVLTNSAPVRLANEDGVELGEKNLFSRILKHAPLDTTTFLKSLRRDLERFVGDVTMPLDVSLVTISREG